MVLITKDTNPVAYIVLKNLAYNFSFKGIAFYKH